MRLIVAIAAVALLAACASKEDTSASAVKSAPALAHASTVEGGAAG